MKKLFFLLLSFVFVFMVKAQQDSVLMTVDGHKITVGEFEYMYQKGNAESTVEKKTLPEYLDMYKIFKLKVAEAEDKGMDTMPSFKNELAGYRSQLAKPYLTDDSIENLLYHKAYEHLQQDLDVSQMLFLFYTQNPMPADTLNAYKRAEEAIRMLKKESFAKVADEMSDDKTVEDNHGHIGYITGLMLPWKLEEVLYSLPVGKVSQPIRVNYGYYVYVVNRRMPAHGQIHALHIMKNCTDDMTKTEQEKAYQSIVDIEKRLKQGDDFSFLASKYSDDKFTAQRGGDLSWFGVGRMVEPFEKAAFALDSGEISHPVKTQYGWHIIKVIGKRGIGSYNDLRPYIERVMHNDSRADASHDYFIAKLKKEYHLKVNSQSLSEVKQKISGDSSAISLKLLADTMKALLVDFADTTLTQGDFIRFLITNKNSNDVIDIQLNNYLDQTLMSYENAHLENKYPNFRYLMNEYHDGLLFFNISNKMVWDKASKDTAGLRTYFKSNKNKYNWKSPHFKGFLVVCKNKRIAQQVRILIRKTPTDSVMAVVNRTFSNDSGSTVLIFKGLWKKGENGSIDYYAFKDKNAKPDTIGSFTEMFVSGKVLRNPESYEDVRGAVISDYQDVLEKEWVKKLEKKHKVIINQPILKALETQ